MDEGDRAGGSLERGDAGNGRPHGAVVGAWTPHYRHFRHHVQIFHCIERDGCGYSCYSALSRSKVYLYNTAEGAVDGGEAVFSVQGRDGVSEAEEQRASDGAAQRGSPRALRVRVHLHQEVPVWRRR